MTNNFAGDIDPIETQEWLDALASVVEVEGPERAAYILDKVLNAAQQTGVSAGQTVTTAYVNSIPAEQQLQYPGDLEKEMRILDYLRWNAMATVVRGGHRASELGGHIASYASAAMLYEMGFNHFFHGPTDEHGGDLLFIQGHCAPGIYARAFLEGRISEAQLDLFRQEVEVDGLSSYPHPWLMPDFWQFATVSMGLGPLQAIYQARLLKNIHNRGLADTSKRKVWVFCGDGEMDEPESMGALHIAKREKLDNLIFVINCNLQRLDGPVHGNGKVVQEFEGLFRGAGWNAIKVLWDSQWDDLLAKDKSGLLRQRMMAMVDGEYQNFKAKDGATARQVMFGDSPELLELVSHLSDDDIANLNFGGHDLKKLYAAYHQATHVDNESPTVILAKTVKGFGMGPIGQGQNTTHQQKKLPEEDIRAFRDRFNLPVADAEVATVPYCQLDQDSEEAKYLQARRQQLGGYLPRREARNKTLHVPDIEAFSSFFEDSGEREFSTTMAFVRVLSTLLKDKELKKHIVPIIPDESRTFGMEGMFRQLGIYNVEGQLYKPVDADQLMYYREDKKGQIFQEGISESGGMASWIAAGTSYSVSDVPLVPFYIYYSMFGFQRFGDLAWAAADMQARGFLLGGTAGRTTLAGEGLQHQDGHSLVLAGTIPNCISYDPTYDYELAVIIQDGMRRMYQENENIYYYITVMNENYHHPKMPEDAEEGIRKGMYLLQEAPADMTHTVQLLGSGTILREVIAAAEILANEYGVGANIWSVTSFNELRKDGHAIERWNRMHPEQKGRRAYVSKCLEKQQGPIIAATDYIRAYAEQIGPFISQSYTVLGTDGYGRSDTRKQLRHFFEVDAKYIVAASLKALADEGAMMGTDVAGAIEKLGIDPEKPDPVTQ